MPSGSLVGVSLDSEHFTRLWLRYALSYLLSKHENALFLLADGLLSYNKFPVGQAGTSAVDFLNGSLRIRKRREDVRQFLMSEIKRLPEADRSRVRVGDWQDFCDFAFVDVFRKLQIAYSTLPRFRACVHNDVENHLRAIQGNGFGVDSRQSLSALYVLEETAMIIRVTELTGRPFDYYPEDQIATLRCVYEDRFASDGLTVEGLTGRPKLRTFRPLPIDGVEGAKAAI